MSAATIPTRRTPWFWRRLRARWLAYQLHDTERYERQLERALAQHRFRAQALRVQLALEKA